MSKRTERREAERQARKLAYKQLRQQPAQSSSAVAEPEITNLENENLENKSIETAQSETPKAEDTADLLAKAQAFFETTQTSESETAQPNSISEAQLAANRANSKLSSGPVTEAGRARSSMNALKHGLTGKTVLLPHEDADQYQRELDDYLETYKPATDEELRLVQAQNDCVWRIDRIQRIQLGIFLKGHIEFANKFEDRSPSERIQLIETETFLKYERPLRNLQIQEARLRRNMEKDRAELQRLQTTRRREEQAAIQAQAQQNQSTKSGAKPANGFDFSNSPNHKPTTAKSDSKSQKQAA